jgi:minor extracellular serine protease Vpr
MVTFTPASASDNSGVTLRVPYYLVPRALSQVSTSLSAFNAAGSAVATIKNKGPIAGDADFYAWGLEDKSASGKAASDIRAVGVQAFPFTATEQLIVFAVNVNNRWSNAAVSEYDIPVDVNGDNAADYTVVGVDQGAVQTGTFNGIMGSFVFSERSGGASIAFLASAPHDSSTILIAVRSAQLCRAGEPCLNAANPRFAYSAVGFDLTDTEGPDVVDGIARFNAWSSSISQGGFQTVPPGGTATEPISINAAEWALTPALGLMIVSTDNKAGADEAQLITVK